MKLTNTTLGKESRLTLMFLGILPFICAAGTYYVKPDGDNSKAGTSWETAFKTPNKGFSTISGNGTKDTLIIGAGHYLLSDACACNGQTMGDEIRGETGNPADVIFDAQGQREVMRISGDILVHGLTITNGSNVGRANYASGVRIGYSDGTSTLSVVSNCVIAGCYNAMTSESNTDGGAAFVFPNGLLVNSVVRGNRAIWRGAGVTLSGMTAEARGCVIEQNIATNDGAAGVWGIDRKNKDWWGAGGRLVNCVVQTNLANFAAGMAYVYYVEGCTIRGNTILDPQHSSAGGMFGNASGFIVTNCTFEGNLNLGGWAGGANANDNGTFVDTRFIGNVCGGITYNSSLFGGGGLLVNAQDRTVNVERCVFANNVVTNVNYTGGAIEVFKGTAVVSDSVITNNTAWRGGGMAVNAEGTLRMKDSILRNNRATSGGGFAIEGSGRAYLDGCTFEANAATNSLDHANVGGGGLFLYQQDVAGFCSVSNCVFAGNSSKLRSGGMGNTWNTFALGEVVNCVFTNNTSVRQGGGLLIREDADDQHNKPFVVRNSLFAFNRTTRADNAGDTNGGGIHFVSYNDVVLDSCTVVSNDSGFTMGGGVHHRWGGTITNCVIAFNTVKGLPEPTTTGSDGAWSMDASCYRNCCIYPGVPEKFLAENGCVNADPLFADPANGNFTLRVNSPCRNVGFLEDWMAEAVDLAGNSRVSGKGVDMGCYEFQASLGMSIIIR